jgi:hypothetical protein
MATTTLARRHAIQRLALGALGAAAVPGWVTDLAAHTIRHAERAPRPAAGGEWKPKALTPYQSELVAVVAELIIPTTDTPGARAAKVHEFVDAVLFDAKPATREKFLNGLGWLDRQSRGRFDTDFIKAAPAQQTALLTLLSVAVDADRAGAGARDASPAPASAAPRTDGSPDPVAVDFFRSMKSMTITGYYTSEAGMRAELDDDGNLFFEDYLGCDDPAYRKTSG